VTNPAMDESKNTDQSSASASVPSESDGTPQAESGDPHPGSGGDGEQGPSSVTGRLQDADHRGDREGSADEDDRCTHLGFHVPSIELFGSHGKACHRTVTTSA